VTLLQAVSLGHAADVQSTAAGTVHSVFTHAVNLEIRGDLWTLLAADRADLPFGIRLACASFDAVALRRADPVHVKAGFVGLGGGSRALVVDCRATPRWIVARGARRTAGFTRRLEAVAAAAKARAWPGSARMANQAALALHDPGALVTALRRVVGCGPGATPAGDDVLVGICAVLRSPYSGGAGALAADALWRCVRPLLSTTNDISAHLLRQAANGLPSRSVHELICALIGAAAPGQFEDSLRRVVQTGATSGADLCLGVVAAARTFLLDHQERAAA